MVRLRPAAMMLIPEPENEKVHREVNPPGICMTTQENTMTVLSIIRSTAVGIALLGAGNVLAEDLPLPADSAPQREQMQDRMRNMTPEEQQLMRETSSDRRAQMESKQSAQGSGMRRGSGGGGRGKGGGRHQSANGGLTP